VVRWSVCALAISCGRPAPPEAPANHVPAAARVCRDARSEGRTFALTVSTDPDDLRASDDAFDRTWHAVAPGLTAPCAKRNHHGAAMRVAIAFKVNRAGAVTEVATSGRDPALDRCVCELIWAVTFPPLHTPLLAQFSLLVDSVDPFIGR